MSRAVNDAFISGLAGELGELEACVLVGPRSLTVEEAEGLRARLRERDIRMRVVKNSLARRAFERTKMTGIGDLLDGPSAVLYGGESATEISKAIVAEMRALKGKLVIHGGYSEGEVLDADGIDVLSKAPTRDEALGMILASFFGPVNELARSMDGLFTEMHGLFEALEKERGEEG